MPNLAMERVGQIDVHLLEGCCLEAERADIVAIRLEGLRLALPDSFHPHMTAVIEETRGCARVLRDLADRAHVNISRVPMTLNYLNIVLPCLSRTLRDMTTYYEDKTAHKEIRWRRMYNKMKDEVDGLPLPHRFIVYNQFLTMLRRLLTRSKNFDFDVLDSLRNRILKFRESRGILPPANQVGPIIRREVMAMAMPVAQDPLSHWAEQIFSLPLSSRTALKQKMILFHCTFLSLKARNARTVQINPLEYKLASERRLFQAQILDDGFKHVLIVYEDIETKSIRLHAAVHDGELRRCPVWTAFVTHQSASPTWLHRKSAHRLWLRDIHPYVFCSGYRSQNQRPGPAGAFELDFVEATAAAHFRDLFKPHRPAVVAAPSSSYRATVEEGDDSC
ncbi:hypothetical protein ACHAQH_000343 [Verticillium albo-atrum]